jgi:hypothetical protein
LRVFVTGPEFKSRLREYGMTQRSFSAYTKTPLDTIQTWCLTSLQQSRSVPPWVELLFDMMDVFGEIDAVALDAFLADRNAL